MKNLSERISERQKGKSQKKSQRNRMVFLALKEEIEAALADGWSLLSIWDALHSEGKIQFHYDAFNRHAKEVFGLPLSKGKIKSIKTSGIKNASSAEKAKNISTETSTFKYNPSHNLKDYT